MGTQKPWAQRAWLAGRIGVLVIVAVAGVFALAHYAGWGIGPMGPDRHPVAGPSAAQLAGATTSGSQASAAGPRQAGPSPAPGQAPHHPGSSPTTSASPRPPGQLPSPVRSKGPAHFRTRRPGARLPSSAQCARWARARPVKENKGSNRGPNQVTGQTVTAAFFPAGDRPHAGRRLAPRINGDFTGTTGEILRWTACKWGIDQNIVFAQAAVESWWRQDTLGDWGSDRSACPPGHGLGQDGKKGQCPQSYGILQNRYPYESGAWPGIGRSTAMNADTAYAIWRSCYDGDETWLNQEPRGRHYQAGDAWGCVGRWFAGRWHTKAANQYVSRVRADMRQRIWRTPDFQQP